MSNTQSPLREIIEDFQREIFNKKIQSLPPNEREVINFRNESADRKLRKVYQIPLELLRYRKDNGRISALVISHERTIGELDEKDPDVQSKLAEFLKQSDPEQTEILEWSIFADGQKEVAIITCDGFLINGNRRRLVLENLCEKHPEKDNWKRMKVVILPGLDEEGGAPTLLEIEEIENRYQFQQEGKAEYSSFDSALSIRRKIEYGLSLGQQMKDDPRYQELTPAEFEKEKKKIEKEKLEPLEVADRYLETIGCRGQYDRISKSKGDSEGRWQAIKDLHTSFCSKKEKPGELDKMNIEKSEMGAVEQAAFMAIRLREIPSMGKIHAVMRDLPKSCRYGKEEFLALCKEVSHDLPEEERVDKDGKRLPPDQIEKKWRTTNREKISYRFKRADDSTKDGDEQEKPLTLLEGALKKITHKNMDVSKIQAEDLKQALQTSNNIKKRIQEIGTEIYEASKNGKRSEKNDQKKLKRK